MKRILAIAALLTLALTACQGNVFELEVGQCFDDPDEFSEVSDVEIVDCADPHDNEVYHLFDISGDVYPGDSRVSDIAAEGCLDAFDAYVGRDFFSSALNATSLNPSEQSWDAGDREVVCFLFDNSLAKLSDSARNSGL